MSRETPVIWMNVTTTSNWQRPAVGVVRVEKELTEGLERLFGAANFKRCAWAGDRFIEVLAPASRKLAATTSPVSEHVSAPTPGSVRPMQELMFPLLARKAALVALAQGALSLAPARFRPALNRALLSAKFRTKRYLNNRAAQQQLVPVHQPASNTGVTIPGAEFKAGDILVSVGLDWDHPYWRSFAALRKTYGIKVVTCCYDLIPVLYPQYCVSDVAKRFTGYFLDVAEGSDLTLCISKQSEADLKSLLHRTGGADVPTHIFPLGDNVVEAQGMVSPAIERLVQEPFVLFVSTIERRKNHEVLYRAYHLLCAQGHRAKLPKMVFVGMPGWGVSELLKDIELDPLTRGLIVQLNHVSDSELRYLYEKSRFFVFPSLYEGWGLPVGEALALGKAVLSSDRGSLPEVGGDLVRYVDPWSPQKWAETLLELSIDDSALAAMEAEVAARYSIRTWTQACESVYRALVPLLEAGIQAHYEAGYDMNTEVGLAVGPVIRGQSKPGSLMFGPCRSVAAGIYQVSVEGAFTSQETLCSLRVVSESGHAVHFNEEFGGSGSPDEPTEFKRTITISLAKHVHFLDVRCELKQGNLDLYGVDIDTAPSMSVS